MTRTQTRHAPEAIGPNLRSLSRRLLTPDTYTWAEKFESFGRINLLSGSFHPYNSVKWPVPSHLHELGTRKKGFVSRIEFIRS